MQNTNVNSTEKFLQHCAQHIIEASLDMNLKSLFSFQGFDRGNIVRELISEEFRRYTATEAITRFTISH